MSDPTIPKHEYYRNVIWDSLTTMKYKERYACTGWIGRNPLYNHISGNDTSEVRQFRRENLLVGIKALYEYTGNPCYLTLADKFDINWGSLARYIEEYERLLEAWAEFKKKCAV